MDGGGGKINVINNKSLLLGLYKYYTTNLTL